MSESQPDLLFFPLRQWMEKEAAEAALRSSSPTNRGIDKNSLLAKTTAAFATVHSIHQALERNWACPDQLKSVISIDNFSIRLSVDNHDAPTWKHIAGVDMACPKLSVRLLAPESLNSSIVKNNDSDTPGRFLEAEFSPLDQNGSAAQCTRNYNGRSCCHLLGVLLYELFSNERLSLDGIYFFQRRTSSASADDAELDEPARKKMAVETLLMMASSSNRQPSATQNERGTSCYVPLLDLGLPSSINTLVSNLLEQGRGDENLDSACSCVEGVIDDLHQLILDPDSLLFDQIVCETNGKMKLSFREGKIYGRVLESDQITEALCRLPLGTNEALFIGGKSGSGKTTLVDSLVHQVHIFRGFLVREKIDSFDQETYSKVMSAFNALCSTIKEIVEAKELETLAAKLLEEFHSDFALLAQLIPDIIILCPHPDAVKIKEKQKNKHMNLKGASFLLRRFVRIISSKLRPVMFFLDDLQWSDSISLEIIGDILCDEKVSSFFFVGNYRNNEVKPDHPIFDMINNLDSHGVSNSSLELGGLAEGDLNEMVSDALGMLPRLCQPLSDAMFRNTNGNPLFSLQYLQSLVDKDLLQYSTQEKRWIWDMGKIAAADMSDDLLGLLSSKLRGLDEGLRSTLSTLACFGIKVNENVVQRLGSTPQFSNLQSSVDQAIAEGFLIKEGGYFKFVHDSIREAAFNLIQESERSSHHFNTAWSLYFASDDVKPDILLFAICDQFKMSNNYMHMKHSKPIDLLSLFVEAGSRALANSDFPRARSFLTVAESLFPNDHWETSYDLCLQLYSLRARSSYSCGLLEESRKDLQIVIDQGNCLDIKLDAYYLMASIQYDCNELEKAFATCCEVISLLDKPFQELLDPNVVEMMVKKMTKRLSSMSENDLMKLKIVGGTNRWTQKFYSLLSTILFVSKPYLLPICLHKLVELCLDQGVTEYSSVGFAAYAFFLCTHSPLANVSAARTIGNLAMSFKSRFDMTEQLPILIVRFSGFVGYYTRTLQECVDMHRIAFDVGMSLGDVSSAFLNPYLMIRTLFFAGANLPYLLKKSDHFYGLAKSYAQVHHFACYEILSSNFLALAGKGGRTEIDLSGCPALVTKAFNFHESVTSFWLRRHERCEFFCKKVIDLEEGFGTNLVNVHLAMFYRGLNIFQFLKGKRSGRIESVANESIRKLKEMADLSDNFCNKVFLLEAEKLSLFRKNDKAKESYHASIEAARKLEFVHEEGIAWELAGFHLLDIKQNAEALDHFNKAKECYTQWGCQPRVDFMVQQIDNLSQGTKS